MAKGDMPVLVGVGQAVSHWDGAAGPSGAPSPLSLAADASRTALADAGLAGSEVDTLAFVRIFEDSVPSAPHPHGHNTNLPGTLAREIGASPARLIYSTVGGQSPQSLVSEFADAIHAGEADCALIAGSEAIGASKAARRAGITLDWADGSDLAFDDRGMGTPLLSRHEIKHGLVAAPNIYALFETAIAAREGRARSAHRAAMSSLFAKFSAVAAENPYAQFPTARSADWLATPSKENYELADPFLKWHVAQDAVNQGAAVLVMSESRADALGIPAGKRVYLHGGGEAHDTVISERPHLDRSRAMYMAYLRAMSQARRMAGDIQVFDLYSCFPCAVTSACEALGLDPLGDPRPLTMTGGLPFFGGPGNNYSLHGIASMVERLRAAPETYGLLLANGGWMTKEAVGIYAATRPDDYIPVGAPGSFHETVAVAETPEGGVLETYTVLHGRAGPERGIAACRTESGARFLAFASPEMLTELREDESQVGRPVAATTQGETNTVTFK